MGKYDEFIRKSLRDEANGLFILANEIAEMNRLKREELSLLKDINASDCDLDLRDLV